MSKQESGREVRSTGRISKTSVETLPRPLAGGRSTLWDTELKGFGVRVTSTGKRTYVLRYRMGGRSSPQRSYTIGQHGSPLTADQARKRASELLITIRSGVDPLAEREASLEDATLAQSQRADRMFDKLADRWFAAHVQGKLRSEADIRGVLERDLKPAFAGLTIDEVTKAKAGAAIETIGARSNAAANKAFKWLRRLLNWLVQKGVIEHSPLHLASRPYPEPSRDRVLSLLEIVVVWAAANKLAPPFRRFYHMIILVGQRLREVSNLPWSEIDIAAAEWVIPAARTKNKRPHLVPLSDQACAILGITNEACVRRMGPVFTTDGKVGLAGFSKMKEALDLAVEEVLQEHTEASELLGGKLAPWIVHDLRRSLATGCQAMGVPMQVTEAVLNHVSGLRGGIVGVYQLYDFFEEKADALAKWGELIDQAISLWCAGRVSGIPDLDPVNKAKLQRRAKRRAAASATQAILD